MNNAEIAEILQNMADLLEIQNIPFKPQAYRNAARTIEALTENLTEIARRNELEQLPGIGKHIAEKITELLRTGKLRTYTQLKKEIPVDV